MEAKTKSTCPANTAGPGRARVELANSAAHQAAMLLAESVSIVAQLEEDDVFMLRALLVRARRLSDATTVLLGLDAVPGHEGDAASLDNAEHEVTHG